MKELSTEEKAKRYEEVLAMAKECIIYVPDEAANRHMLNMFPELAESEDERIRKSILEHIQLCSESIPNRDIWIAWLEKQGAQKSSWSVEDELMLKDAIEFIETGWSDKGKSHLVYWLKSLKSKL